MLGRYFIMGNTIPGKEEFFMKWNTDADWQRVIEKTRNAQTYTCVYPDGSAEIVSYGEVFQHNVEIMRKDGFEVYPAFEMQIPDTDYLPSLKDEILEGESRTYGGRIIGLWQDFLRWALVHPGEKIAYDRETDLYTDYVFFLARHGKKSRALNFLDSREKEYFGIE